MKNWLILGNFGDLQSALYIYYSLEELKHNVRFVDIRGISSKNDFDEAQKITLEEIDKLDFKPDNILVLKGLELSLDTLNSIRDKFKDAKIVNWFFDVFLQDKPIWEKEEYFPFIKFFDFYFCSLRGVATKLQNAGFKNAHFIGEGCFPSLHGEQYMNGFQEKKYGEDIAFCANIGYSAHSNRLDILSKIIKEGFNMKIWGNIVADWKSIPPEIRPRCTQIPVINERHSMVCQSSLINLGVDQMPELDGSWSARLHRVMCAGGLYLNTATKGLDAFFKINKEGEEITKDQELVVYYNEDDLIKKLDWLLENSDVATNIAKNGQKKVLSEHKWTDRLKEMIKVIKNDKL